MNSLADELIRLIMEPVFIVSENYFAANGPFSPFATVSQSTGEFLRVCKRWMRITTPLLYETVVIRSRDQAYSLNLALSRCPDVGRFTRRLRLEGVYGDFLTPDIYETMPNVKQLCFTETISQKGNVNGLQRAFKLFDVERVVLTLHECYGTQANRARGRLIEGLRDAIITRWSNLKHFTLPHSPYSPDWATEEILLPALAQAPQLETVTTWRSPSESGFPKADQFTVLLKNPSFRHLFIQGYAKPGVPSSRMAALEELPAVLCACTRFVPMGYCKTSFRDEPAAQQLPIPANKFWTPLARASREDRLKIWTRILRFALTLKEPIQTLYLPTMLKIRYCGSSFDVKRVDHAAASACIRVSKDISTATKRVLATWVLFPSTYRRVPDNSDLRHAVARDPFLLNYVQSMEFDCTQDSGWPQFPPEKDLVDGGLLARLSRLQDLSLTAADRSGFAFTRVWPALQFAAVKSLVSLSVQIDFMPDEVQLLAEVFRGLDALQRLEWDVPAAQFTLSESPKGGNDDDEQQRRDASLLPRLQELKMTAAHSTFYATLAQFALPCFRSLTMTYYVDSCLQLLQAHGSKIITLGLSDKHLTQPLFDLVPNATTLRLHVSCAEPRARQTPHHYLGSPAHEYDSQPFVHLQHVSVQRIIPLWEGYGSQLYKTLAESLRSGVGAGNLPALRVVQPDPHVRYKKYIWPKTEQEARYSHWVSSQQMLAQVNVALLDFDGQPYRERKVYVPKREKRPIIPRNLPKRRSTAHRSPVVLDGSECRDDAIADPFSTSIPEGKADAITGATGSTRRSTRSAVNARSVPLVGSSSGPTTAPREGSRRK